ncbi:MAG: ribosomal protein S18 acetylase RimI-like enzyme [Lentimonas sp.]|jgi:ribosomal protein S18 acetylase RimI-like enzyme
MDSDMNIVVRDVSIDDVDGLVKLELHAFENDRLSRRSFIRSIKGANRIFQVIECEEQLVGYGLVHLHRGTRLARLYSIALDSQFRGQGLGRKLLAELETRAAQAGRFFMRLEVAHQNEAAIRLYEVNGYKVFGELHDYYEDHSDALRMQKRIRFPHHALIQVAVPWYRQTTSFTCGPAALMMAMATLRPSLQMTQGEELDLWREATTIYMTSGHGGCHPMGLALAAQRRGFGVEVFISQAEPLFVEGVRTVHKKEILNTVHHQFVARCREGRIPVHHEAVSVAKIESWLQSGFSVLVMVSSYRMNGDKAPHWVVVTASDELCLYLHDPEMDKHTRTELDCQHIPIAKEDFSKMTCYGSSRCSTALLIGPPDAFLVER